ncbi:hypothetical protein OG874_24520 [Nocardia sp. NBC_00565]|uniref:hypothetical protein n=1 Tax=Nocardia sp. NBC_00565 TaxID=2975993 RepID=UPI002E81E9F0|nr:hypothetical protein [Nocardia sp. NBC_00565]WUC00071.1 hypothetical protein OG874_24520 [Nocardia sp. NBC_00565]
MSERRFVRFEAASPNRHGRYPGVFGLVNGLARAGVLTGEQERFRRVNNDWYNANLVDPSEVDPGIYDRAVHPGAASWFKAAAVGMIGRVEGYLAILDAHGVGWVRLDSGSPGEIVYEDSNQVVAVRRAGSRRRPSTARLV